MQEDYTPPADPGTPPVPGSGHDYPLTFSVDYPDRSLNRLTTFFRIFTVIPIVIILALIAGSFGGNYSGSVFKHPAKSSILTGESADALEEYIKFSVARINIFLSAVRSNVTKARWTTDKAQKDRLLTVTYVNAFLITLRMLIGKGKEIEFDYLKDHLLGIDKFDFKAFHSSQYNRMAEKLVAAHFS